VKLVIGATNRGKVYAKYVSLKLALPELILRVEDRDPNNCIEDAGVKYYPHLLNNTQRDVTSTVGPLGTRQYGPSWFDPILPGGFRVWEMNCIPILRPEMLNDQKLRWHIQSDNSPGSRGEVVLRDIKFNVRDEHEVA
jgi:hypothetical protein